MPPLLGAIRCGPCGRGGPAPATDRTQAAAAGAGPGRPTGRTWPATNSRAARKAGGRGGDPSRGTLPLPVPGVSAAARPPRTRFSRFCRQKTFLRLNGRRGGLTSSPRSRQPTREGCRRGPGVAAAATPRPATPNCLNACSVSPDCYSYYFPFLFFGWRYGWMDRPCAAPCNQQHLGQRLLCRWTPISHLSPGAAS